MRDDLLVGVVFVRELGCLLGQSARTAVASAAAALKHFFVSLGSPLTPLVEDPESTVPTQACAYVLCKPSQPTSSRDWPVSSRFRIRDTVVSVHRGFTSRAIRARSPNGGGEHSLALRSKPSVGARGYRTG